MTTLPNQRWCKKFLTEADAARVSEAVHRAEAQTCGEIVPMIVHRSSAIGHVPLQIFSLWVIVLFAAHWAASSWWNNLMEPWWYAVGGILLAPLVLQLGRLDCVCRALIPDSDEIAQVFRRARLEFDELRIHHTQARTGILIFLSAMEHRCVVLADEGIAAKLPPETWQGVVDKVIGGIKRGQAGDGLVAAIEECGSLLAKYFPLAGGAKNELANDLVIKE